MLGYVPIYKQCPTVVEDSQLQGRLLEIKRTHLVSKNQLSRLSYPKHNISRMRNDVYRYILGVASKHIIWMETEEVDDVKITGRLTVLKESK